LVEVPWRTAEVVNAVKPKVLWEERGGKERKGREGEKGRRYLIAHKVNQRRKVLRWSLPASSQSEPKPTSKTQNEYTEDGEE
jgi:hypothetical protein